MLPDPNRVNLISRLLLLKERPLGNCSPDSREPSANRALNPGQADMIAGIPVSFDRPVWMVNSQANIN